MASLELALVCRDGAGVEVVGVIQSHPRQDRCVPALHPIQQNQADLAELRAALLGLVTLIQFGLKGEGIRRGGLSEVLSLSCRRY